MINHPLADAFPMMEGDDYEGLKQDIKAHGVRHPVVTFENKILDGRNRKKAAQELGIPAPERKFDPETEGDPAAFVASENLHRRHMDRTALTLAAERLATAMAGRPRKNVSADNDDATEQAVTVKEAAALLGVAEPSVRKVRKVRKDAIPEVQAAMDDGHLTPTAAVNMSRKPAEEQKKIMETVPIKDVPTVAASVTSIGEAPSLNPAGGRVGPKVVLTRQMNLPDLTLIQKIVKDWAEHEDVIPELDAAELKKFAAELRKSRTAYTRLIELIALKTKAPDTATPRSNGSGGDTSVPTEPPAKRAAPAPKTAVRKSVKTPVAAKKAAAAKAPSKELSGESLAAKAAELTAAKSAEAPVTGTLSDGAARTLARTETTENKDA